LKAETFIGLRYLWNSRRTRFLSVITMICILGIAIGVAALIAVQSIMDGLQNKMRATVLGAKTHALVTTESGKLEDYAYKMEKLASNPEIAGITPVISRDVIISVSDELNGLVINGIDPATVGNAMLFPQQIQTGSLSCMENPDNCPEIIEKRKSVREFTGRKEGEIKRENLPGIAIGVELAKYYGIGMGDKVKIISPTGEMSLAGPKTQIKTFQVAAIFFSSLYEYDFNYAYITLANAQNFFSAGESIDYLGIKLKDMKRVDEAEKAILADLGTGIVVKNWRDMNRPLFSALEMEKIVWFLIIGFIALVASFNIVSALIMLVMGKKEEIAILRAGGYSAKSVMKIFMLDGIIIGFFGTLLGGIFGTVVCLILSDMPLKVAQDVYYIEKIPVDMSPLTFIAAIAGSLFLTVIAAVYPGRKAAKLSPAEALRQD
jgi:ABC-type transport system, involved in lipoprotein release, permease component